MDARRVTEQLEPTAERADKPEPTPPPPSTSAPVCADCNDTHRVYSTRLERDVGCTRCPVPCQKCRMAGNGGYCEKTPCPCDCHAKRRPQVEYIERFFRAVRDEPAQNFDPCGSFEPAPRPSDADLGYLAWEAYRVAEQRLATRSHYDQFFGAEAKAKWEAVGKRMASLGEDYADGAEVGRLREELVIAVKGRRQAERRSDELAARVTDALNLGDAASAEIDRLRALLAAHALPPALTQQDVEAAVVRALEEAAVLCIEAARCSCNPYAADHPRGVAEDAALSIADEIRALAGNAGSVSALAKGRP